MASRSSPGHASFDSNGTEITVSNLQAGAGPAWFLLDTTQAVKPIIFQERIPYEFQTVVQDTDAHVFLNDEFLYGVRARLNVGFGFWQMAFGSQLPLNAVNYAAARAAMNADGRPGAVSGGQSQPSCRSPALEADARMLLKATSVTSDSSFDTGSGVWRHRGGFQYLAPKRGPYRYALRGLTPERGFPYQRTVRLDDPEVVDQVSRPAREAESALENEELVQASMTSARDRPAPRRARSSPPMKRSRRARAELCGDRKVAGQQSAAIEGLERQREKWMQRRARADAATATIAANEKIALSERETAAATEKSAARQARRSRDCNASAVASEWAVNSKPRRARVSARGRGAKLPPRAASADRSIWLSRGGFFAWRRFSSARRTFAGYQGAWMGAHRMVGFSIASAPCRICLRRPRSGKSRVSTTTRSRPSLTLG